MSPAGSVFATYGDLIGRSSPVYERQWNRDDAILYALSVGAGSQDATAELEYTTEGVEGRHQKVLPGFASVLGKPHPDAYSLLGDVAGQTILQSAYELEWGSPMFLPTDGRIEATTTVTEIFGHVRGSFVTFESCCTAPGSRESSFVARSKVFVTGLFVDGAAKSPKRDDPTTDPDLVVTVQTCHQQALVHRLLGDRNPLHCDPVVAARSGFDRPILHGLCTFGIAARIVGRVFSPDVAEHPTRITGRLTAAVVPGDRLRLQAWKTADAGYRFSMIGPGQRAVLADGEMLRINDSELSS